MLFHAFTLKNSDVHFPSLRAFSCHLMLSLLLSCFSPCALSLFSFCLFLEFWGFSSLHAVFLSCFPSNALFPSVLQHSFPLTVSCFLMLFDSLLQTCFPSLFLSFSLPLFCSSHLSHAFPLCFAYSCFLSSMFSSLSSIWPFSVMCTPSLSPFITHAFSLTHALLLFCTLLSPSHKCFPVIGLSISPVLYLFLAHAFLLL